MSVTNKNDILAVIQVLKKYNLKDTENILKQEANLYDIPESFTHDASDSVLQTYESGGDPDVYNSCYYELRKFVDSSLDTFKFELNMILYPVFVHMYIELVYNGHECQAKEFMEKFGPEQEYYYQDDIKRLSMITKRSQMRGNDLADTFRSNEFIIRISRDTLSLLKRHLQEKKISIVMNIINEHLYFDLYEGMARNKKQCEATAGSLLGEARRQDNRIQVYHGLLKEPDYQLIMTQTPLPEDEDENDFDTERPKKKKIKKDILFGKKGRSDPNAPLSDRVYLPQLREIDINEKIKVFRETQKRVSLGPDSLPSVCYYTLLNSLHTVTCAEIAEDSSLIAIGFSDATIKVWTMTPAKLNELKSAEQLKEIDTEVDDILVRMLDERKAETSKMLLGHAGPVYNCSFTFDRSLLLSCSEDCTIRLWSLQTWTCLVVYKGHLNPVWDVKFSPHGYYFVSCSHDKTARVWATDSPHPLRIFAGHLSDVDVCTFHPNSNYIATGSSDRTVRLWDVLSGGSHVRLMTGHKGAIYSLVFSKCGRYLASGSSDKVINVWDLEHGHLVASLDGHTSTIHSLCFSRDGTILASGALDCKLKLWDFSKLCEDLNVESFNVSHNPNVRSGENYLLRTFPTKKSPFITLHFSRRNLLYGVGLFNKS
ncbi:transcription initiation factor TFIID subunit 5-like [Chironomus tepperi]|uniref:transcription initiation factor TFIID subunit 5-like n=1 Tax=Chironomus tepperi TaxID=113505 RepID=UPI00391EF55C